MDKLIQINSLADVLQITYIHDLGFARGEDAVGRAVSYAGAAAGAPGFKNVKYRIEAGFPSELHRIVFKAAGRKGGDKSGCNWGVLMASADHVLDAEGKRVKRVIDYGFVLAHEVGHFLRLRHRGLKALPEETGGDGLLLPMEPVNMMQAAGGHHAEIDFDIAQVYVAHDIPSDG